MPTALSTLAEVKSEVKRRANLVEVLGRVGFAPSRNGRAGHAQGLCPWHGDAASPSLHVYPDGHCHCFGACGRSYDVFDAWTLAHGGGFMDALRGLARETGVQMPAMTPEQVVAEEARRATERLLEDVAVQATAWLWAPEGADALAWLRGRRLTDDVIREARLGYWPDWQAHRVLVGDTKPYTLDQLRGVGFLAKSRKPGSEGREFDALHHRVLFPVIVAGRVASFLGRALPGVDAPKTLKLAGECPALYGTESVRPGRQGSGVVVVEGEIDTLTVRGLPFAEPMPVVGLLGAGANLDAAAAWLSGFGRVVIMVDADPAGREAAQRLGAMLGSRACVATPAYPEGVKDPNDLVKVAGPEAAAAVLHEAVESAASYLDWMLAGIEAEPRPDVRARRVHDEVVPFLAGVEDIERAAMIGVVSARMGAPRAALDRQAKEARKAREPAKVAAGKGEGDDTSDGSMSAMLADRLVGPDAPFLPLYLERTKGDGTLVTLYSHRHGTPVQVSLSAPRQAVAALAPDLGDVESWVQHQVPAIESRAVAGAVVRSLSRISAGLRPRWDLLDVAEGFHALRTSDNRTAIVLVDSSMRAIYDTAEHRWVKADSPIVFDRFLLTSKQRVHGWLPPGWNVEGLNRPLKYTAREAFEHLFGLVNDCWSFTSEADLVIAAMLPFALTWSQLWPAKPLIHVTAQTMSGKSLLVQGLYAGKDGRFSVGGMMPTAYYNPDPTSAGLIGAFSGSSRTIILDEFERSEERSSGRVNDILQLLRTASTGNAARLRGNQELGAREDSLSVACISASIEPIGARDADRNRWYVLELAHYEGRDGPELRAPRYVEEHGIDVDELRRSVALGLVDRVDELRAAYEEIRHAKDRPGRDIIDDRWMSNVWPCLAVYSVLGFDWRAVATKVAEGKAAMYAELKGDRKGNRLLDTLLFTPFEMVSPATYGTGQVREQTTLAALAAAHFASPNAGKLELPWLGCTLARQGDSVMLWAHPETVTRSALLRGAREFGALDARGFANVARDCDRWVRNSAEVWSGEKRTTRRCSLFRLDGDSNDFKDPSSLAVL